MREIHVDGQPFAAAQRAATFGELLAVLDPAAAAHARIVTAIRIGGVEEPAFREAFTRTRALPADGRIEVATETVGALAQQALADAVRLMPEVSGAAIDLGRQLSLASAEAHASALAELAEGLTLLVTLVQAAEAWADAAGIPRADWLGGRVVDVARCIDAVNDAQRHADWVSVADALAYDLAPALDAWHATLAEGLAHFRAGLATAPTYAHAPQG